MPTPSVTPADSNLPPAPPVTPGDLIGTEGGPQPDDYLPAGHRAWSTDYCTNARLGLGRTPDSLVDDLPEIRRGRLRPVSLHPMRAGDPTRFPLLINGDNCFHHWGLGVYRSKRGRLVAGYCVQIPGYQTDGDKEVSFGRVYMQPNGRLAFAAAHRTQPVSEAVFHSDGRHCPGIIV